MGVQNEPNFSERPAPDSVATLLAKLGDPPEDVWREWQNDAAGFGVELPSDWRQVDWSLWQVDAAGRIRPFAERSGEVPTDGGSFVPATEITPTVRHANESTGRQSSGRKVPTEWWWMGGAVALVGVVGLVAMLARMNPRTTAEKTVRPAASAADGKTREQAAPDSGRTSQNLFASAASPPAHRVLDENLSGENIPGDRVLGESVAPDNEANLPPVAVGGNNAKPASEAPTDFSLDAFLPPSITDVTPADGVQGNDATRMAMPEADEAMALDQSFGQEKRSDATADGQPGSSGNPVSPPALIAGASDAADVTAEADELIPDDESPTAQPTRGSNPPSPQHTAVRLPPVPGDKGRRSPDDSDSPELVQGSESISLPISAADANDLRLEFPGRSSVELRRGGGADDIQWNVVEMASGAVLATLDPDQEAEKPADSPAAFRFRWHDAASDSAAAGTLMHGRIVTPSTSVALRPRLAGEPLRLDLSGRDKSAKWDLEAGVIGAATRLDVAFNLPENVTLGWIEAVEPDSVTKARGLAVVQQKDDEDVALLVRLDIRTGRWLSMHARYAARLDRQMPWQWTDQPTISQSMEWAMDQSSQVRFRYEQVNRMAGQPDGSLQGLSKEMLQQQGQRLEKAVEQWQILTERLATLDQLMTATAAEASVGVRLSVSWPDREQIIFSNLPGSSH